MKTIFLAICMIVATAAAAIAGMKHVKPHYTSDGRLVHEHYAIEPGGESWQYWIQFDKGKGKSKGYPLDQRPYGAMRLAPEGTVEPIQPSDIQDFDNDPFDTD